MAVNWGESYSSSVVAGDTTNVGSFSVSGRRFLRAAPAESTGGGLVTSFVLDMPRGRVTFEVLGREAGPSVVDLVWGESFEVDLAALGLDAMWTIGEDGGYQALAIDQRGPREWSVVLWKETAGG